MDKYLLIESRDPFETNEVRRDYDIAISLAEGGNRVTMFLQNGVSASRRGAQSGNLSNGDSLFYESKYEIRTA